MTYTPPVTNRTNPCSNCGMPVSSRRPSKSGMHWCKAVLCQRARSKFYRSKPLEDSLDREKRNVEEVQGQLALACDMLAAGIDGTVTTCPQCKADDVYAGFPHPSPEGAPCRFGTRPEFQRTPIREVVILTLWPRLREVRDA